MVNAFWLDRDVDTAVRWLVDDHVMSSVFECSMVLTTAAQLNGATGENLYYTHENHPLTQWAADAYENWRSLRAYTEAAHREWRYRWDHSPEERHGCWATVETLDPERVRGLDWPNDAASDPPQVTGGGRRPTTWTPTATTTPTRSRICSSGRRTASNRRG